MGAVHDDATRTLTHIDARETETVTTFDALRRPLDERLGHLLRSRRYDPNGNLVTQTDYAGHTTTFEYDDANRLDQRHEGTDGGVACSSLLTIPWPPGTPRARCAWS